MTKKSLENSLIANKFAKRLNSIPAEIISKIAKIDELKGSWITCGSQAK